MKSEGRETETEYTDEELVLRARRGDTAAEEAVIRRYFDVLEYKSSIYYIAGADRDDVFQEGMIGLLKAVRSYDGKRGTSFRTYAGQCINNQIINAIRGAARDKHRPLNDYEPLDEDVIGSEDPVSEDIRDMLGGADMFSPMEKRVLSGYLQGKSYSGIAEETGGSVKAVDNAMQRIKKKIKGLLF